MRCRLTVAPARNVCVFQPNADHVFKHGTVVDCAERGSSVQCGIFCARNIDKQVSDLCRARNARRAKAAVHPVSRPVETIELADNGYVFDRAAQNARQCAPAIADTCVFKRKVAHDALFAERAEYTTEETVARFRSLYREIADGIPVAIERALETKSLSVLSGTVVAELRFTAPIGKILILAVDVRGHFKISAVAIALCGRRARSKRNLLRLSVRKTVFLQFRKVGIRLHVTRDRFDLHTVKDALCFDSVYVDTRIQIALFQADDTPLLREADIGGMAEVGDRHNAGNIQAGIGKIDINIVARNVGIEFGRGRKISRNFGQHHADVYVADVIVSAFRTIGRRHFDGCIRLSRGSDHAVFHRYFGRSRRPRDRGRFDRFVPLVYGGNDRSRAVIIANIAQGEFHGTFVQHEGHVFRYGDGNVFRNARVAVCARYGNDRIAEPRARHHAAVDRNDILVRRNVGICGFHNLVFILHRGIYRYLFALFHVYRGFVERHRRVCARIVDGQRTSRACPAGACRDRSVPRFECEDLALVHFRNRRVGRGPLHRRFRSGNRCRKSRFFQHVEFKRRRAER